MRATSLDNRITTHMALEGGTARADDSQYPSDDGKGDLHTLIDAVVDGKARKGNELVQLRYGRGPRWASPCECRNMSLIRAVHTEGNEIVCNGLEENPRLRIKGNVARLEDDAAVCLATLAVPR